MTVARISLYSAFIIYLLLSALPLSAAETNNPAQETPTETPHPQSIEAIKQMGDELEADRKAREAAAKAKKDGNESTPNSPHSDKDTATITKQDLDRLKQQCDDAREELIAPLREKAIQECIAKKVKTADQCAQFYKDYGESGVTASGGFRQRMFHDIPECQPYYEAEKKLSGTK